MYAPDKENKFIKDELKHAFQTAITDPTLKYTVSGTELNDDVLGKDYFSICRELNSNTHSYICDTFGNDITVIEFSKNNNQIDGRKHKSLIKHENLHVWCRNLYSDSSLNESQLLGKILECLLNRGYVIYGCEMTTLDDHKEIDFKLVLDKELYILNVTIHTK